MIQRIQTLYIIVGILLILGITFFVPHSTCNVNAEDMYLFSSYAGVMWFILFSIFSLIAILKFKNRKIQMNYINGNLVGILLLILTLYIFDFLLIEDTHVISCSHNWMFDIGCLTGFICFLLARRSIKKDEDLINSINRLR